jgi:hypothetical protein
VREHHRLVGAPPPEETAVDLRVQGLHPAVHDLGEPGVLRDVDHGEALGLE